MLEEMFNGMLAELWLACGREQPEEAAKAIRELTPAEQERVRVLLLGKTMPRVGGLGSLCSAKKHS